MNDSKTSKICVVMPTFNNAGTLRDMVERTLQFCPDVIVVNDGCTDTSAEILSSFGEKIIIVDYGKIEAKDML